MIFFFQVVELVKQTNTACSGLHSEIYWEPLQSIQVHQGSKLIQYSLHTATSYIEYHNSRQAFTVVIPSSQYTSEDVNPDKVLISSFCLSFYAYQAFVDYQFGYFPMHNFFQIFLYTNY